MTMGQVSQSDPADEVAKVALALVPPARGVLDESMVDLAVRLVELSAVLPEIAAWKAASTKGPGGRPATFNYEAMPVALVACAITDQPLHLSRACDVMFRQLSSKHRSALGIPDPPAEHDTLGWDACYRNVRTRWADLIDLMDPSDTPKNRRLNHETFVALTEQRRAERSDEERAIRYDRLEWFINRILEASLRLLPREIADQWLGSVGVDATLVVAHARPQRQLRRKKSSDKPEIVIHSADPGAAWYSRERDHRNDNGDAPGKGQPKVAWGYEATLVISGSDDPRNDPICPNLAVGMAVLHKPGHGVGRNGARALAQVCLRGHPAGFLAADRAYSNAKPEDFQLPVRALGYRPVYDYKINQLGVMSLSQGFLQIEGAWYCPSIPKPLVDATIDLREGRIDEVTYQARLEARWGYLARPKGKPDPEGHVRLSCPAANPWPLVRCDLKPSSLRPQTAGRGRIELKVDVKADPPPSCSQQSVTIPPEAGAKFHQELLYGGEAWHATYATLRNTNEGFNGYVKDPDHEALDDPGRRRLHGVAPQSVATAVLLLAANVRKIRTFLEQKVTQFTTATPRRPRRRRSTPLQRWIPQGHSGAPASTSDPPLTA